MVCRVDCRTESDCLQKLGYGMDTLVLHELVRDWVRFCRVPNLNHTSTHLCHTCNLAPTAMSRRRNRPSSAVLCVKPFDQREPARVGVGFIRVRVAMIRVHKPTRVRTQTTYYSRRAHARTAQHLTSPHLQHREHCYCRVRARGREKARCGGELAGSSIVEEEA